MDLLFRFFNFYTNKIINFIKLIFEYYHLVLEMILIILLDGEILQQYIENLIKYNKIYKIFDKIFITRFNKK